MLANVVAGAVALAGLANAQPFPTVTTIASLHSTNPTAVPLASIYATATEQSSVPLSTTGIPGATPPISGAPPLPTWAFSPTLGFPALDAVPPTNSTLVQQWIAQVKASGVTIPNIPLSKTGACADDEEKVGNSTICWWTCGGCTRPTDITTCPDKLTWGLSYDDGPSPYSADLLNYLNYQGLHTTYFIVGSRAISRPEILQAEFMSGHQLSVHTWSHPYLTTLTNEQVIAELGWTKKAIHDITGLTPNTMRPPYGDIDDRVRAIAKAMDLVPIMWSNYSTNYFDTNDWYIQSGYPVDGVINTFEGILNNASELNTGFIVLEHDLFQTTVDLAIGYLLPDALARKEFTFKSIIECLNQPLSNAYIETNNNGSNPLGYATTFPATGNPSSAGSSSKGSSSPSNTGGGAGSSPPPASSKGSGALGRVQGLVDGRGGVAAAFAGVVAAVGGAVGALVVL